MLLYGLQDQNQLIARKIVTTDHGTTFDAYFDGCFIEKFKIPLYGNHNVLNSLAVIGVCIVQNMNLSQVKNLLQTFPGVKRRFEEVQFHSNILIDDYAHNPKEIEATLGAVKAKYPNQSIISIFQPHSHSRLKHFLFEFTDVLKRSDQVYLCQ